MRVLQVEGLLAAVALAAEEVLESGGLWLGDTAEQAAEDPWADRFMFAMERLRSELDDAKEKYGEIPKEFCHGV
jgi:hypothetical protein